MAYTSRILSLWAIEHLAAQARAAREDILAFAGSATVEPAPNGLSTILRRGGTATLGTTAGLTLIKSAAAFGIPSFVTRNTTDRQGGTVRHFAEVQGTSSADATHECHYPGPGDHVRPGMSHRAGGRVYTHHWRVSRLVSELVRQGEEEHLADAQRAYELTYKLIADTINGMSSQRFGPARTPAEATRLAEADLAKRLPAALGTDPRNWVVVLDRLLEQTTERDRQGWHAIATDPPRTVGSRVLYPVVTTGTTRIGQVPSSQVVRY